MTVQAPVNNPPTVSITAPADGTSVTDGTSIGFSGTANDTEDGNISGSLSWTSSLDGNIGSGGSFNATLSVGTHTITASATDSGGASDSDSITVTVTPTTGDFEVLTSDDFESGFGSYTDGGSDCRRSANDSNFAHQGTFCIRIRDNSGSASSFFSTNPLDLTGRTELKVNFWYVAISMETNENFFVEFFDGSSWQIIGDFVVNVDFSNGTFENPEIIIDSSTYNFNANNGIRIRCDASGNGDRVYVDEVVVSAR